MVTEQHILVRWNKVFAVFVQKGRGFGLIFESENLFCDELAVETVATGKSGKSRSQKPNRINRLATSDSDVDKRHKADRYHKHPKKFCQHVYPVTSSPQILTTNRSIVLDSTGKTPGR